jgi:hypothetical protein
LYASSINIELSQLDKIRLVMSTTEFSEIELEKEKKTHLNTFEKYLEDIKLTYKKNGDKLGAYKASCEYKLKKNIDTENDIVKVRKKVGEAIYFYSNIY